MGGEIPQCALIQERFHELGFVVRNGGEFTGVVLASHAVTVPAGGGGFPEQKKPVGAERAEGRHAEREQFFTIDQHLRRDRRQDAGVLFGLQFAERRGGEEQLAPFADSGLAADGEGAGVGEWRDEFFGRLPVPGALEQDPSRLGLSEESDERRAVPFAVLVLEARDVFAGRRSGRDVQPGLAFQFAERVAGKRGIALRDEGEEEQARAAQQVAAAISGGNASFPRAPGRVMRNGRGRSRKEVAALIQEERAEGWDGKGREFQRPVSGFAGPVSDGERRPERP